MQYAQGGQQVRDIIAQYPRDPDESKEIQQMALRISHLNRYLQESVQVIRDFSNEVGASGEAVRTSVSGFQAVNEIITQLQTGGALATATDEQRVQIAGQAQTMLFEAEKVAAAQHRRHQTYHFFFLQTWFKILSADWDTMVGNSSSSGNLTVFFLDRIAVSVGGGRHTRNSSLLI